MEIEIKILNPMAGVPSHATTFSAGYDLVACINEPLRLCREDKATLIPTGIAICTHSPDVAALILPRSGLGHKKGLVLGNGVGLIDGDYQAEWFVSAWNRGQEDVIEILPGDRIAQVIFVPVLSPQFIVVNEFSSRTDRNAGGFGSTGVRS